MKDLPESGIVQGDYALTIKGGDVLLFPLRSGHRVVRITHKRNPMRLQCASTLLSLDQ